MWYALAFFAGGIPALVFFLQLRSKGKKLRAADKKVTECRGVVERLRGSLKAADDDNDRLTRAIRVGTEHVDTCAAQVTDAIKEAARVGADDSVLRLVSSSLDGMRKLSEAVADSGDEGGGLHRRDQRSAADNSADAN